MRFKIIKSSSNGNCYIIEHNKYKLIIDPGINFDRIANKLSYNFENTCSLISHIHWDHMKSTNDLIRRGIKCYCNINIRDDLLKKIKCKSSSYNLKKMKNDKMYFINGFKIKTFELSHSIKNYGFLIKANDEKLLYIIDTNRIDYKFTDLTYICIECNYDEMMLDPLLKNTNIYHLEINDCKKFLKQTVNEKTKEIYLLHISQRHGDRERFRMEMQEMLPRIKVLID